MNKQTQFIKVYSILTEKSWAVQKVKNRASGAALPFFPLIRHALLGIAKYPKGTIAGPIIVHWTGFLKFFFRCLKMNSLFLKRPSKEWIDDTSFINGKEKNQEHACGKWQRWAWCKARKLFQQSIPFRGTLPAGTSGRREFQARHAWFTGKKAKQPQAHRFLPFEQLYFVKSQNITIDFYKQCLLIHCDIALLGIYIISFICIAEIHFEIWSYRIEIWQVTIIAVLEPYFPC